MRFIRRYSIKKYLMFPLLSISLCFLIISFFKTGQVLTIRREDDLVRGIFSLHENETFQVRFNHSLYHVPQFELWRLEGGSLVLQEVRFGSLAAAEYYSPTLTYQRVSGGEWLYRVPKGPPVGKILIRVGYIANHTLLWRGQAIPFTKYLPSGDLAVLQLEKRPLIWIAIWRAIKPLSALLN